MATIDEYCDREASNLEFGESEEFEREVEGFVPDDSLDRAQEWSFWVEGEEGEDFDRFQVNWKTDRFLPRNPKQTRTEAADCRGCNPLDVFLRIFTDQLWDLLVTQTNIYADQTCSQTPSNSKWNPVSKTEMKNVCQALLHF